MTGLLLVSSESAWIRELKKYMPELEVSHFPEIRNPEKIAYSLAYMPELGLMKSLPNLKVIFSLAAGVDHLLRDPDLPDIPIVRMRSDLQVDMMSEAAVLAVLYFHRGMHIYRVQQQDGMWKRIVPNAASDFAVGILGQGEIGREISRRLRSFGFSIRAWTRTPRKEEGVSCHHGAAGLADMLPRCRYVVNVLPMTPETKGILGREALERMPAGSFLINLGRGAHIDDDALLDALDAGHLEGALLDVFAKEPLPSDHLFWRHPKVVVTPHMAGELGPMLASHAAASLVETIRHHQAGGTLRSVYQPERGY